ncbi:MAG: hypothetical protein NTY86_15640 [Deltaproteobacteria bacterium]|nr:hypothetical protein [Deltaproteobacteria bacterium]
MARMKRAYNEGTGANENTTATLGIVGSAGFIFLTAYFLFVYKKSMGMTSRLSLFIVSGSLLAIVGGFSSVVVMFITPQIRAYNRISVYLAFFSFFALAFLIGRNKHRLSKYVYLPLLLGLFVLGILDQTTLGMKINQPSATEYLSDKEFFQKIERTVPRESMIWQLPYMLFPETPHINNMPDYSHLRAYLHSDGLRWSYGAMKGRKPAYWMQNMSMLPVDNMAEQLSIIGFSGIYIDRSGYVDAQKEIEGKLASLLDVSPIISKNNRLAFYDMTKYNVIVRRKYSAEELERKKRELTSLSPAIVMADHSLNDLSSGKSVNIRFMSGDASSTRAGKVVGSANVSGIISDNTVSLHGVSSHIEFDLHKKEYGLSFWACPDEKQVIYADLVSNHKAGFIGYGIEQNGSSAPQFNFGIGNGKEWRTVRDIAIKPQVWNLIVLNLRKLASERPTFLRHGIDNCPLG